MNAFTCRDYRRLLSDVLEAPQSKEETASWKPPVSDAERASFDTHGAECPECLAHMKNAVVLRDTLAGLAKVEEADDAAAPALPEALVKRILEAAKTVRESVRKKG